LRQGRKIVDTIVGTTKYHAVVSVYDNGERLTRFANSEIHQNVEVDDTIVNLTLCEGRKSASAQTNALDPAGDGGWPLNAVMDGGEGDLEGMIAWVKKGILVTHFHYCNAVNPKTLQVTGLTRDGTFMIEDGKVTTPLKNMRFTESLPIAFSNITALSKDTFLVGMFGGVALLPAIVIENFHFTSGQDG